MAPRWAPPLLPVATTRWGLPLVAGIGAGHDRFNALSRLLAVGAAASIATLTIAIVSAEADIERVALSGGPGYGAIYWRF